MSALRFAIARSRLRAGTACLIFSRIAVKIVVTDLLSIDASAIATRELSRLADLAGRTATRFVFPRNGTRTYASGDGRGAT